MYVSACKVYQFIYLYVVVRINPTWVLWKVLRKDEVYWSETMEPAQRHNLGKPDVRGDMSRTYCQYDDIDRFSGMVAGADCFSIVTCSNTRCYCYSNYDCLPAVILYWRCNIVRECDSVYPVPDTISGIFKFVADLIIFSFLSRHRSSQHKKRLRLSILNSYARECLFKFYMVLNAGLPACATYALLSTLYYIPYVWLPLVS